MPKKEEIKFEDFLRDVAIENLDFVQNTHEYMLGRGFELSENAQTTQNSLINGGCSYKIEIAKSGYVLSYVVKKTKKVIANYVFRKNAMLIRIYGDNISKYEDILNSLPENMVNVIEKAPACKRLLDPDSCNPRCIMGYTFDLNGKTFKNCRYSSFMFEVKDGNFAAINAFLKREMEERVA